MEQNRLRTEYLIKGMSRLGCNIINTGIRDYSLGDEFLLNLQRQTSIDFVSANVYYADSDKRLFEPFVIRSVESVNKDLKPVKVGVIGLCQPRDKLVPVPTGNTQLTSRPFYESVKKPLEKLSKKADIVILLYHGTFNELMELLEKDLDIDVVVLGGQYYRANQYDRTKPILVSTPPLGKYLSKIELTLDGKNNIVTFRKERLPLDEDITDDPEMQELIRQYDNERSSQ